MDEPTAGLDPSERDSLHGLLIQLSEQRLVLLSTHIVEDIENLCPHVAMINDGKIIQSRGVKSLLDELTDHIWISSEKPADESLILNQSYQYGQSQYRIYAVSQPTSQAVPAKPSLQDCYFFALKGEVA
jgi:ABC-type multidrug transport system ATPase subunit